MLDRLALVARDVFKVIWYWPHIQEASGNIFFKDWRSHPRIKVHPTVDLDGETLVNVYSGYIYIDEYSFFGQRCMLIAGAHDISKRGKERKVAIPKEGHDIKIGKGVFIGSGAIIIGPCTIGDDAVIGAGSVVTSGDYESGCLYAGNPAVFKKRIGMTNEN